MKTETTNEKSEEGKANSEAKKTDDGDEVDDDFMFEMDEDSFHQFQQAEVEAENGGREQSN